jgi:hypothetical protein
MSRARTSCAWIYHHRRGVCRAQPPRRGLPLRRSTVGAAQQINGQGRSHIVEGGGWPKLRAHTVEAVVPCEHEGRNGCNSMMEAWSWASRNGVPGEDLGAHPNLGAQVGGPAGAQFYLAGSSSRGPAEVALRYFRFLDARFYYVLKYKLYLDI